MVSRLCGYKICYLGLGRPIESDCVYCVTHGTTEYSFFPHVKYIVLIRDPRDSILSNLHWLDRHDGWCGVNHVPDIVEHYCQVITARIYRGPIMGYNPLIIQFERMCLNPEVELQKICDFVGCEPMMSFEETISIAEPNHRYDGWERYIRHCLKWQRDNRITDAQVELIWDMLGLWMQRFGYMERGHSEELLGI